MLCLPLSDDTPCLFVCLSETHRQTCVCLFVGQKHTDKHGKTRRYPYSPYSRILNGPYDRLRTALGPNVNTIDNLCHICHVSISHSVQWNTLLLSWGKRERGAILSADHLLEADSLQIGASIVASRGPARGLRPVHNFSIQFNSI